MIEHLFMLTCGWVGGVVSALLIRHMLDGRRPLDPALIPTSVAMPIAALPQLPPAPQLSPFAPKKVLPKPTQRRDAVVQVWRAAKQDRPPRWVTKEVMPAATKSTTRVPDTRPASVAPPPVRATALLPSIAWGQPHGGEGSTLTQEAFTMGQSADENGRGAQAPRRRP